MNISEEVIKASSALTKGGVIIYPTDTIWGLGCDAMNSKAIEKIMIIKKRPTNKSMLVLLDQAEKLSHYVDSMPAIAWDLITQTSRPTTFIYPKVKNLPKILVAADGSAAIRITNNDFCKRLIRLFGNPIVSTSVNYFGQAPALKFSDIRKEIIKQVDYVVDPNVSILSDSKPSTIIRFLDDYSFEIVRD